MVGEIIQAHLLALGMVLALIALLQMVFSAIVLSMQYGYDSVRRDTP
jgi:hypothetical protein